MKLEGYSSYLSQDRSNAVFRAQQVIQAFQSRKLPDRLLDVGCGSGELLRFARAQGVKSVTGVDGVQDALDRCGDLPGEVRLVDLNASGLPFQEGCFDAVTCLEVLEHLYAPRHTLMEIVRVTQPGGRVIVSVPNPFSYSTRLRILFGGNVSDPSIVGGHIKFFRRSDLLAMCGSCGLRTVRSWGVAYPTAYEKYGALTNEFLKWMPALFATWWFALCEKPS